MAHAAGSATHPAGAARRTQSRGARVRRAARAAVPPHACAPARSASAPSSPAAWCWGDEGHRIVGEIASRLLRPAARQRAFALLAADTDPLAAHDVVSQTVWADRWRDSDRDGAKLHYLQTRQWHFVDIERRAPDIDRACFGHPALPAGTPASAGPAAACVVDKIDQFTAELAGPGTAPQEERLLALKYVLHFVGDVHQPLHAGDDRDAGGNAKQVTAPGAAARQAARLLGHPVRAARLHVPARARWRRRSPRASRRRSGATGRAARPRSWAQESSRIARSTVCGPRCRPPTPPASITCPRAT